MFWPNEIVSWINMPNKILLSISDRKVIFVIKSRCFMCYKKCVVFFAIDLRSLFCLVLVERERARVAVQWILLKSTINLVKNHNLTNFDFILTHQLFRDSSLKVPTTSLFLNLWTDEVLQVFWLFWPLRSSFYSAIDFPQILLLFVQILDDE